jgi:hypothetical protein
MLHGMPAAERNLARHTRVGRLLMVSNVPVGEQAMLVALPLVKILVRGQVRPRHFGVVGDVPAFDISVIGRVLVHGRGAGRAVLLRHVDLLTPQDDVGFDATRHGAR